MLEGGTDSVFFENFIYNMLDKLRRDPSTANKDIVLFMDNAAIHKNSIVFETARRMKANILFNAEYSP
jgi:transposase